MLSLSSLRRLIEDRKKMIKKEIAGFKNLKRGYIFCLNCHTDYLQSKGLPQDIAKEFSPIYKGENWEIGPSCTQCNKIIIW